MNNKIIHTVILIFDSFGKKLEKSKIENKRYYTALVQNNQG